MRGWRQYSFWAWWREGKCHRGFLNQMKSCPETWVTWALSPALRLRGLWSLECLAWTFLISPMMLETGRSSSNTQVGLIGLPELIWALVAISFLLGILPSSTTHVGLIKCPRNLRLMPVLLSWDRGPTSRGKPKEKIAFTDRLVCLSWDHEKLGQQMHRYIDFGDSNCLYRQRLCKKNFAGSPHTLGAVLVKCLCKY